jgi:hypothetical protein
MKSEVRGTATSKSLGNTDVDCYNVIVISEPLVCVDGDFHSWGKTYKLQRKMPTPVAM